MRQKFTSEYFKSLIGKSFGTQTLVSHIKDSIFLVKCTCGNAREQCIKNIHARKDQKFCMKCKGRVKSQWMIGKTFGKMQVIDFHEKFGVCCEWKFICRCECGNEESIRGSRIKRLGSLLACKDCSESERNLTGETVGKCKVLKRLPIKAKRRWYECLCACGNKFHANSYKLTQEKYGDKCLECRRLNIASGKAVKDFKGQKIGQLKVIGQELVYEKNAVLWKCQCECGNICHKSSSALTLFKKACCDECKNSKKAKKKWQEKARLRAEEIHKSRVGKKFNRLKVKKYLGYLSSKTYSSPLFLCKCSCGNEVVRLAVNVANGYCKSCGCLKNENHPTRIINDEELEIIYNFLILRTYSLSDLPKIYGVTKDTIIERLKIYITENNLKMLDFRKKYENHEISTDQ